jgi:dipeptidyl-peptidase 4
LPNPGFDREGYLRFKIVAISRCLPLLFVSAVALAQPPAQSQRPAPADPNVITIQNVCDAALPRAAQGKQFRWSPDGKTIAYFKPVTKSYGLTTELDAVNADGSERRVLLTSKSINELFPSKPTGHQGNNVPPPKETIGFQWGAEGGGLLIFSDLHIFWLDTKTLKTTGLVTGEEPISDIQLSPDGRSAAFVRNHNLWAVETGGGAPRALTRDGTETLHKGELDWLYPAELGTKHGYAWSPDSSRIAYFEFNLGGVATYTPPFQSAEESPAPTIDYPTPGSRIPQVRAFVLNVNGVSKAVAIDTGTVADVYLPRLQWLPDGKHLALQRLNRGQSRVDLLLADAATGSSRVLLSDKDLYWINLSDILYFLKDAPQFLWSSERSGYRHLYLYGLDGKLIRQVTDGTWEVNSLDAVDERGQKIYFTSTEKSSLERQVYVAGFDGQGKRLLTGNSGTHLVTFAPDASSFVDYFSTATKPWSRLIYKLDQPAGSRFATKVFALDEPPAEMGIGAAFGRVNFLTVTTHDRATLNALLIQPARLSPGKKYPTVVYVAGGPGQQAVHDAWDGDLSMWQQLLAQHGYIVFAVDNRGAAGRGHLFEEPIHYKFSGEEIPDQHEGLDFLRTLPYVDTSRIGVWGRGFGGMLTLDMMLHPRLMALQAGFAIAPIVDWFHYDTVFAERYLGSPVSNLDGYLASSPLDNAHALRSPLLVAQGVADLRVHPDQTMELQHELVEAKKSAEISLYPGQGHTIDGPDACIVSYQRATDFFAKSL